MTSASLTLPAPIDAYFAASSAGDYEALAQTFGDEGFVHDEGEDIRGQAAIAAWARNSKEKYDFTSVPNGVTVNGNEVAVTSDVSGSFPGSPILMTYEFTLAGDKIATLTIHD